MYKFSENDKTDQDWISVRIELSHQLTADWLNLEDKRVDPGCWLKSGFESPRRQLVLSLYLDPISCGRYTVQ